MFVISSLLGLKKIVALRLSKYGFEYAGKRDSISWIFTREVEDVSQFVAFEKIGANPNSMRFTLSTSVSRETIKHYHLAKELSPFGLVYEDEDSYYAALESLTDVIIESGIDWLTKMSKPDVLPSNEIYERFMDSLVSRQSAFIEINNMDYNDSDFIEKVEHIVRQYSANGAKEPNWEFIMDVAITLGEYVRMCFGGEWGLFGAHQRPYLTQIGGKENIKWSPLVHTAQYWGRPYYEPYSIKNNILGLQKRING